MFDGIDQGFCVVEMIFDEAERPVDYRFLEVNRTFEEQTGLVDAQGKRMRELVPKHEEHWFEVYGRVARTGEPVRFENRAEQLGRYYEVYAFRLGKPEDRRVGVLFKDIRERKTTEEELVKQASFPGLNPNPIVEFHADGAVTYLNPAARALFPDLKTTGLSHPWLGGLETELVRFRRGDSFRRSRTVRVGGRFYHQDILPVGEAGTIRIYAIDITDRVQAEEAYHRQAEKLEKVLEAVPVVVWIVHDPEGRHMTGNPMADELLRIPRGWEASLNAPPESRPTHFRMKSGGRELDVEDSPVRRAARGEAQVGVELDIEFDDGTVRNLVGNTAPLLDDRGTPRGSVAAYLDITERKRMEEDLRRSLRRLDLLATTAGELLRSPEPQEAVESVCRRVMEHLDCHVFINYLADETERKLRLNACAGIPEEEVRKIEWLEYGVAVCGCAARDGRRVVAEHIPSTQDARTELVKSFGVKAYACHPLQGPAGKLIGTLSFGTRSRETFSEEELSLMKAVTDHVAMAMNRKKVEESLRSSLEEKDILLRELSHRTKNNMQVIVDLLGLQKARSEGEDTGSSLKKAQDRIRAMALVHEKLYRSGNVATLSMKEYVGDLVVSLLKAHQGSGAAVEPEMELGEVSLSLDAAVPCGLIINELVSNSLKHAFDGRDAARIFLSMRRVGEEIELRYRDDGRGLPSDFDMSRTGALGMKLIRSLALRQLGGRMEVVRDPQSEFVFRFRDIDIMGRM